MSTITSNNNTENNYKDVSYFRCVGEPGEFDFNDTDFKTDWLFIAVLCPGHKEMNKKIGEHYLRQNFMDHIAELYGWDADLDPWLEEITINEYMDHGKEDGATGAQIFISIDGDKLEGLPKPIDLSEDKSYRYLLSK